MRFSPFGVIVGGLLSVIASLPLIVPSDTATDPAIEQAQRDADRARAELAETEQELAEANRRLEAAGIPPVIPTTATTVGGSGPQAPSDGLPDAPGATVTVLPPGVSEPELPPTTAPSSPSSSTTTGPPVVGTTSTTSVSDDGCPPGYHPVIVVTLPPSAARVCLRD